MSGTFTTGPGTGNVPGAAEFFAFGDQKYVDGIKNAPNIEAVAGTVYTDGGATTGLPLVHTGDFAVNGGNDHGKWLSLFQIDNVQKLFAHTLILPTPGNHDIQISGDYSQGNATNYTRFFPFWSTWTFSDPRQLYYHKIYRPFHFFSLTSEPMATNEYCSTTNQNYRPSSEGGTGQYEWLEQQLSGNDGRETPWKIVFMHAPIFSPAPANYEGDCNNQQDARTYLVPLFEKYGVDIFFSGHEHYYARKTVDGIPYLILGGGGAGLSLGDRPQCNSDPHCFGFDYVAGKHHYADIVTHGDVMTVHVRDENNDDVETFTVDRTPKPNFGIDPVSGQAGATVRFTDTSTGHRYQYEWDFGDGTPHEIGNGRDASTEHVYATDGTYSVTLTITSAYQSVTKTCTACVTIGPKAEFDATPVEGALPLTVRFQNESDGDASSWLWNFGDGETSTDQNPVHTYQKNGKYSVSLTASNNGMSDRKVKSDFIKVEPYALFGYDASWLPLNDFQFVLHTRFTNLSKGIGLSYYWEFGDATTSCEEGITSCGEEGAVLRDDSNTSREENPSHDYSRGGLAATLTVTDSAGRTDRVSKYIEPGSGVPFTPETMAIDIMPSSDTNMILITPLGRIVPRIIRVAILSIDSYPASELNLDTLTFGRTGNEASLKRCNSRRWDVNGDGHMDLICRFKARKTGFRYAGEEGILDDGILRGMTTDGRPVEGRDYVQVSSMWPNAVAR